MKHHGCGFVHWLVKILVIVGALNWGLVGVFNFDLVNWLFVQTLNVPVLAQVTYILVGISALLMIYGLATCCKSK